MTPLLHVFNKFTLSPGESKRLQERIAQAVEQQKGRLGETRKQSIDEARNGLRRGPGGQQRQFYER